MTKIIKKSVLAAAFVLLMLVALVSCSKDDGTLKYKSVKGGYEVVGLSDESAKDIVIPENIGGRAVVSVADGAFRGTGIESVSVPATVKSFGLNAFELCASLGRVTLDSADSLADASFENMYSSPLCQGAELYVGDALVTEITFYGESVADYAYAGCRSLQSVKLSGVKSVGIGSFNGCASLASIDFGASLESIGASAFSGNATASLNIPESVKSIGHSAFSGNTALVDAALPSGVTELSDRVFFGCSSLRNINIDNITVIGIGAFYDCAALESVNISEKTSKIEEYAFYNCGGLKSVNIPENSSLEEIGEAAFRGCSALEAIYLDRASGLKSIDKQAFEYCVSLQIVTLPFSLETLGDWAFASCPSLELYEYKGVGYIGNDRSKYILAYKLVDEEETSIVIANGAKFIHQGAFLNAKNVTSISMSSGVVSIGSQAFAFCTSLEEIVIAKSVRSLGDGALMGCVSLAKLRFKGTKEQWTDSKNENYVKRGTNWNFNIGSYKIYYG